MALPRTGSTPGRSAHPLAGLAFAATALAPVVSSAGDTPLEVVLAVDTSGSMAAEIAEVRDGLNRFATLLRARGYDPRMILIASSPALCIPAPLGSGQCPADESLPGLRHVVQSVDSNDALAVIVASFPAYQASLRAGSLRWVIVVSDDNADQTAATFTTQFLALDPGFQDFRFHAIASSAPPFVLPPNPCFGVSGAAGAVYQQLVAQRDGVFYDLCLQDFDPAWQRFAALDNSLYSDGFEDF